MGHHEPGISSNPRVPRSPRPCHRLRRVPHPGAPGLRGVVAQDPPGAGLIGKIVTVGGSSGKLSVHDRREVRRGQEGHDRAPC